MGFMATKPSTLVLQTQIQILIISGLFWSPGSRSGSGSDSSKTGSADSDPVKSGLDLQHCCRVGKSDFQRRVGLLIREDSRVSKFSKNHFREIFEYQFVRAKFPFATASFS